MRPAGFGLNIVNGIGHQKRGKIIKGVKPEVRALVRDLGRQPPCILRRKAVSRYQPCRDERRPKFFESSFCRAIDKHSRSERSRAIPLQYPPPDQCCRAGQVEVAAAFEIKNDILVVEFFPSDMWAGNFVTKICQR